jgi:hypothetical protein
MPSLYQDMLAAGVKIDSHESDLYVEATPSSVAILKRYPRCNASYFRNNVDGKLWIDIPFAYDPFWPPIDTPRHPFLRSPHHE